MKKLAVILMLVVMVFGCSFLCEAAPKNNPKKVDKSVPLEVFVQSVLGRTRENIKAMFGKPSCEGSAGMVYENFVRGKDGSIVSVVVSFDEGFPIGTVKIKDGKRVVGSGSVKYIASTVMCPYGEYSIKPSGDPFIQGYDFYHNPTPYGRFVENSSLSCSSAPMDYRY